MWHQALTNMDMRMSQISSSNQILLQLSLVPGIGPATIEKLRAFLGNRDWSLLPTLQTYELQRALTPAMAEKVATALRDGSALEQEMRLLEKHAIQLVTINDEAYPSLLRHIHLPPPVLYVRGSVAALSQRAIAMVGSRQANRYAQQAIDLLVPPLVAHGYIIVSGGARGADSMAHAAALQANGSTIAILGAGLLSPYPMYQRDLFERIAVQGALISPFPLRLPADEGTFPARNRIIAGLCDAVIVVQAAEKSGARITAQYALDQGREVGVVPGPIFDPLSAGCHALAMQGASLITSAADIFALMGVAAQPVIPTAPALPETVSASLHSKDPIIGICRVPQSFDQLLMVTQLGPQALQERLFTLTIEGHIQQNSAGLWVLQ